MKTVTILALESAMSASVMGAMDIFAQSGFTYNYLMGRELKPYFEVKIASRDGKPVKCFNDARILPHCGVDDVKSTDLLIISSFTDFEILPLNKGLHDWVKEQHDKGTTIGSVCLGSFFLAETGLLDGKTATTHWGFVREFRKRFPRITLQPEKRDHQDEQILAIQDYMEEKYFLPFNSEQLAREFGMSRRTFERRFKKATHHTPILYLQRSRVEAAKQMLETSLQTFDEIAYNVGYEDSSFFRKVFVKHTGLRPSEYKAKFHREAPAV